jgi:hypothetical protein
MVSSKLHTEFVAQQNLVYCRKLLYFYLVTIVQND